jgi:hypothetical protein
VVTADRGYGDQQPQTGLRMGPHPPGRHPRSSDLDRAGGPGAQPGQDRRPDRLTRLHTSPTTSRPGARHQAVPGRTPFFRGK